MLETSSGFYDKKQWTDTTQEKVNEIDRFDKLTNEWCNLKKRH